MSRDKSSRKPVLSVIAAMARNRVIGIDNRLPWHLPADLQHFKTMTLGKPLIMGRKTWQSLPGLLPGRPHIVISRTPDFRAEGAQVARSLDEAIALAGELADEVMLIGGANLYQQALPLADRLYLTLVDAEPAGDAWFPDFDEADWRLESRQDHPADERNRFGYSFLTYRRA
jgi:dihydrofolate reductase